MRIAQSRLGIITGMARLALMAAAVFAISAMAPTAKSQTAPQLVILDTDIGDDIDDAYALALVLRSPELKPLGIVTAYGDTESRARITDRFLGAVGRTDIPVYAGVQTPVKDGGKPSQAPYGDQKPGHKHKDGIAFILEQIRKHPGEITLITIGPLEDVKALTEKDAATFKKLKRVVMMGGSIEYRGDDGKPVAEWNIVARVKGSQALMTSGVPIYMMPLDSTIIPLKMDRRESLFSYGSPMTDQLTLLYHQWMAGSKEYIDPTLFDPVAVTYTFRPDICPTTPMHIDVDDEGYMHKTDGAPNVNACLKSDENAFLDLIVSRLRK